MEKTHSLETFTLCKVILKVLPVMFLIACEKSSDSQVDPKWKPLEIFSSCNKVAIGNQHALVVNDKGELYGWGSNHSGELEEKNQYTLYPIRIRGVDNVKCVSVGRGYSAVIKNDGTVWQWGEDNAHRFPGASKWKKNTTLPVKVEGIADAVGISSDGFSTLVLNSSGNIYSWGGNTGGQLGRGMISLYEQVGVIDSGTKFRFINAGGGSSFAIDDHGKLWVWGSNVSKKLGIDDEEKRIPRPIENKHLDDVVKISSIHTHVTALTADGKVKTWGFNIKGWLGTENSDAQSLLPTAIDFDGRALDISNRSLLTADGDIWRWGNRYFKAGDVKWNWFWFSRKPSRYYTNTGATKLFVNNVGVLVNDKNCLESWGYSRSGVRGDGTKNKQKVFFNKKRVELMAEGKQFLCIKGGVEE